MNGALHFGTYDCGLGHEQILHVGVGEPCLLILPPLFDEMHKLRRTLVMAMRALANRGMASALPDVPGLNESSAPLDQCRLPDWEEAVCRAADTVHATHVASLRSASILDDALSHLPRWRYAPVSGERVATQMIRAQLAGDKSAGRTTSRTDYELAAPDTCLTIGGYRLSAGLLNDVRLASPMALSREKDLSLDGGLGPALWLRAEPGESADLADALAQSWAEWMST